MQFGLTRLGVDWLTTCRAVGLRDGCGSEGITVSAVWIGFWVRDPFSGVVEWRRPSPVSQDADAEGGEEG